MLIAQQRTSFIGLALNLPPGRLGQFVLAVIAVALVLGPLLLRDAPAHHEQHGGIATPPVVSVVVVSDIRSPSALPVDDSIPATPLHNHCEIHCSLASLILPPFLLDAPLLAARLCYPLLLDLTRLSSPPLSPPPQPTL